MEHEVCLILLWTGSLIVGTHGACSIFSGTKKTLTAPSGEIKEKGTFDQNDGCAWELTTPSYTDVLLKVTITYLWTNGVPPDCTSGGHLTMPNVERQCDRIFNSPSNPAKCFLYTKNPTPTSCSDDINAASGCSHHNNGNWPLTFNYIENTGVSGVSGFELEYEFIDCTAPLTTSATTTSTTTPISETTTTTTDRATTTPSPTTTTTRKTTKTTPTKAEVTTTTTPKITTGKMTTSRSTKASTSRTNTTNILTSAGYKERNATTKPTVGFQGQAFPVGAVAGGAGGLLLIILIIIVLVIIKRKKSKEKETKTNETEPTDTTQDGPVTEFENPYSECAEQRVTVVRKEDETQGAYDTLDNTTSSSEASNSGATYSAVTKSQRNRSNDLYSTLNDVEEETKPPSYDTLSNKKSVSIKESAPCYDTLDHQSGATQEPSEPTCEYAVMDITPKRSRRSRKMRSIRVIDPLTKKESIYADMSGPPPIEEGEDEDEYDSEFDEESAGEEEASEPQIYAVVKKESRKKSTKKD